MIRLMLNWKRNNKITKSYDKSICNKLDVLRHQRGVHSNQSHCSQESRTQTDENYRAKNHKQKIFLLRRHYELFPQSGNKISRYFQIFEPELGEVCFEALGCTNGKRSQYEGPHRDWLKTMTEVILSVILSMKKVHKQ